MARYEKIHEQLEREMTEAVNHRFDEITTMLDRVLKMAKSPDYGKQYIVTSLEEILEEIG